MFISDAKEQLLSWYDRRQTAASDESQHKVMQWLKRLAIPVDKSTIQSWWAEHSLIHQTELTGWKNNLSIYSLKYRYTWMDCSYKEVVWLKLNLVRQVEQSQNTEIDYMIALLSTRAAPSSVRVEIFPTVVDIGLRGEVGSRTQAFIILITSKIDITLVQKRLRSFDFRHISTDT